jgi:hypothetical protein
MYLRSPLRRRSLYRSPLRRRSLYRSPLRRRSLYRSPLRRSPYRRSPYRRNRRNYLGGATTDEIPVEVEELPIPQLPKDLRYRILEMRRRSMLKDYRRSKEIPTINGIITSSGHPVDIMEFSKNLKSATEIACYIEGQHRIDVNIDGNIHHLVPHCEDDGSRIIDADYRLYMSWANIMENHINKFTNLKKLFIEDRNPSDWVWDLVVDLPPSLTYLSVPFIYTNGATGLFPRRMTSVKTLVINSDLPEDKYDSDSYDSYYPNITTLIIQIDDDNIIELKDELYGLKDVLLEIDVSEDDVYQINCIEGIPRRIVLKQLPNLKTKFTNLQKLILMEDYEPRIEIDYQHWSGVAGEHAATLVSRGRPSEINDLRRLGMGIVTQHSAIVADERR